jgi:hypothetical protein
MGYASWLRTLVRDRELPYHLSLHDLGKGAGDPLARVKMAIDRPQDRERKLDRFAARYLFLDTDQLEIDADRAEQTHRLVDQHRIKVIWQNPTHEAFLLRHFPGCHTLQPPNKRAADQALMKEWNDYCKPCTAPQIERQITLEGAIRVANSLPELRDLLRFIGLLGS